MSYYDHDQFIHAVPAGYTIPEGTQVYCVESAPHKVETFFVTLGDLVVPSSHSKTYYLDYDITRPKPPEEINSVIYNVSAAWMVFSVAVYQGNSLWSAFSKKGARSTIYTSEIESFDTTPPAEESES